MANRIRFPGGRPFAFTIVDDTDVATRANVEPLYQLIESLGMRTTKTVWALPCPEGSRNFSESETLEDEHYRAFVVGLQARGFEIASHGATMESSERPRIERAFRKLQEVLGRPPRMHVNHSFNRENIYWGVDRFDSPAVRWAFRRLGERADGYYQGHIPDSTHWWGDLCQRHVDYVRNLTFDCINVLSVNPSMPYHDPRRPLVRWWFSAAAAEGAAEFCALLSTKNLRQLEAEGGVCIVATHLGKGFVSGGEVHEGARACLEEVAQRGAWCPPASELLDYLRAQRADEHLPASEWRSMQRRWLVDAAQRTIVKRLERRRRRRLARRAGPA
jgi:hypothetical protein